MNLAAGLAQFRADTDQEYLSAFFIPGLRKAGDFRAGAVLDTNGRLLLHHVATEFPADWPPEKRPGGQDQRRCSFEPGLRLGTPGLACSGGQSLPLAQSGKRGQ